MSYKCLSILRGVFSWRQLYFVPWISPSPCHPPGRRRVDLGRSFLQDPSPKGFGLCGGYRNGVGWDVHHRVNSQQRPFPKIRSVLCWAWQSYCQDGACVGLEFGSCQLRLGWAEQIVVSDAPVAPQPAAPSPPQIQQCPFLSLPHLVSKIWERESLFSFDFSNPNENMH